MRYFLVGTLLAGLCACSGVKNKAPEGKTIVDGEKEVYKIFRWNDVKFHFAAQKNNAVNMFKVWTEGMAVKDDTILEMANGNIYNAFMNDLDQDNYPELYLFVKGFTSSKHNEFYGYASVKNDSMQTIGFDNNWMSTVPGYSGFDTLMVDDNQLVWEHPVYQRNDNYKNPTGGTRQIIFDVGFKNDHYLLVVDTVLHDKQPKDIM